MVGTPRFRFAPSPTGYLHVGGARTALFNYLLARKHGGRFVLRIEDTDEARSTPEATEQILRALSWLGINWDEGPGVGGAPLEPGQVPSDPEGCKASYFQSDRAPLHRELAMRLWREGKAFYSHTERAGELKFDEVHRNLTLEEQEKLLREHGGRLPLKLKVPRDQVVEFEDRIRGRVRFNTEDIGDFIILKSSGSPVYNFACVVDDYTMGITHVVRGDDHLANTPKQLLVYQALGFEPPQFCHVPMILGPDGKRLSKRHGATEVLHYREMGILPMAMVNFLALIGWHGPDPDREEYFSMTELLAEFDWEGLGRSPGVFNLEKLLWLNGRHIRHLSDEEYLEKLMPYVPAGWRERFEEAYLREIALLEKERLRTLAEFEEKTRYFFEDKFPFDERALAKQITENERAGEIFAALHQALGELGEEEFQSEERLEEVLRGVAEELGLKFGKVAQPLRVALTGGAASPSIFSVVRLLGRERVLGRVGKFISPQGENPR